MKIQDVFRSVPGGAAVSGATVTLKKHSDDSTVTTATTDANGLWTITRDMHPGPVYWEATDGYTTRRGSSKAYGMAGPLSLYELVYVLQALGDGVVSGALNGFAVTAAGANRNVNIASGAALVQGIPAVSYAQQTLTLDTADSGNPRIDTVVIEVTPAGQANEGKSELKLVKGTPAASPAAPALTQTSSAWQHPLADVRLNAGASSVTSVTDRRGYLLQAGALTRNPTVMAETHYSATGDVTITSTSGQQVSQVNASVTLLAGVTYDIVARGMLMARGSGTNVSVQTYIGDSSLASGSILTVPTTEFVGLGAVSTRTMTGTGATVTCSMLARKITSGGTATYRSGYMVVQAIPRS